jgi:hypothetical protein
LQVLAIIFAAGLTAAAPKPAAQVVQAEQICLTFARYWAGSTDDIRHIEQIPVPASYLDPFNAGGCTRFQLVEESLVDWHFRFGDERTAAQALAFLEADYAKGFRDPSRFATALSTAIRRARPLLIKDQAELNAARKANRYVEALRPIMKQDRIAALRELLSQHEKFVFLTQQYTRAAEFYGSAAFLEKARQFHEPASAGVPLIYGRGALADAEFMGPPDWQVADIRDLTERLAIIKARLTGDPADVDQAQAVLDNHFDPAFRIVLHEPVESDEVCDLAQTPYHEDLKRACDADANFELTLTRFWTNQAHLDLLKAAEPSHYYQDWSVGSSGSDFARGASVPDKISSADIRSVGAALTLLNPERTGHVGGMIRTGREDRRIALHIESAEALAKLAEVSKLTAGGRNRRPDEYLRAALGQLEQAADLVRPSEQPGRFRQIANSYLQFIERIRSVTGTSALYPVAQRQSAYFRAVLAKLDQIELGE